ncbi:hypothetical protein MMC26_005255 [Xylographa opegraphella]|nr:hypothetical protein [Xylographa opegraphella]
MAGYDDRFSREGYPQQNMRGVPYPSTSLHNTHTVHKCPTQVNNSITSLCAPIATMVPGIASREDLSSQCPTITPFSAINGSNLRVGHHPGLIMPSNTGASDANLEFELPEMHHMPLEAQSNAQLVNGSSGESAAIVTRVPVAKVAEVNGTSTETGDKHRPHKAMAAFQNTISHSNLKEVDSSEYYSNDDRTSLHAPVRKGQILLKIVSKPGSATLESYEGTTITESTDHGLHVPREIHDQVNASAGDSSTVARNPIPRNQQGDKCSEASGSEDRSTLGYNAPKATAAVAVPNISELPTTASEQGAVSSQMPHQDNATSGLDARFHVRPDNDQPLSNEVLKDNLHSAAKGDAVPAPEKMPERTVSPLDSTNEAHSQKISNVQSPDTTSAGSHNGRSDESGTSHIPSRKRKASQEIIDRNPTGNNNVLTKTQAATQPMDTISSEAATAANCGTSTQVQEEPLKVNPPSSAIAPVLGISIRNRGKRKIKPEIYVTDSQSLWTKWPYGNIRSYNVHTLFARLAETYELPPEQVWAVQFTFPSAKGEPSLVVSRKDPDSLGLLLKKMWEVAKSCKDDGRFQMYADPQIDPDAECELELEDY